MAEAQSLSQEQISTSTVVQNKELEIPRVLVVINPVAKGNSDEIVKLIKTQASANTQLDIRYTQKGMSIAELLGDALDGAAMVIAAGGDGTVAASATAIGYRGIPLAIIPIGSANVIAREQRIPLNVAKAVQLIFGKHTVKPIDAGVCGDRWFLHMAGAGIDSRLFLATDRAQKRRFGWLAYLGPAMRNIGDSPSHFKITMDGSYIEIDSPLVLVANGSSILNPQFPVYQDIRPDDGWLDVIVVAATSPTSMMAAIGSLVTRQTSRSPYVMRFRARTVELDVDPPLPLQLDGDVVGETPARFHIDPRVIRLIVPSDK